MCIRDIYLFIHACLFSIHALFSAKNTCSISFIFFRVRKFQVEGEKIRFFLVLHWKPWKNPENSERLVMVVWLVVFHQPLWKNITAVVKLDSISSKFGCEHKKYLSCHHLVIVRGNYYNTQVRQEG